MLKTFFRITPGRILTLNNRWWDKVRPKKTLFFLPVNIEQLELWKEFLCKEHKRSFVFLHEVYVDCPKYRYRKLTTFKDQPLYEILVKQWDLHHVIDKKVLKVFKNIPINIRYFPSRSQLIYPVDEEGNRVPFSPKEARKIEKSKNKYL